MTMRRRVHLPPERIGEARADLTEAARHYLRDVLRLAAVRRARERELIVPPPELVEAAGLDQRHHLERP